MITGELKSKIDRVWDAFWSGGISNPLEVIEQITHILLIRRLDDIQTLAEKKAHVTKNDVENSVFIPGQEHPRWSQFRNASLEVMHKTIAKVFPFLRGIGDGTTYSEHMKDARFTIANPALMSKVIDMLDGIPMADRDTNGDLYEYLLSKIAAAGRDPRPRRHTPHQAPPGPHPPQDTLPIDLPSDIWRPHHEPPRHTHCPLGALADVMTGNSPSRAKAENSGDSIEWIESDNLGSHVATLADEWLSEQGRRKARIAPAESILVTCIAGSSTGIGKASLVNRDVAFNQQINAILPSTRVNADFLLGQRKTAPALVRAKSTGGMKDLVNKTQVSTDIAGRPPTGPDYFFPDRSVEVIVDTLHHITQAAVPEDVA